MSARKVMAYAWRRITRKPVTDMQRRAALCSVLSKTATR